MFSDYHLVRWNKFFDAVETALKNYTSWDRKPFLESSCEWEKNWSNKRNIFTKIPKGNPVEVSRIIWKKYAHFLMNKASN